MYKIIFLVCNIAFRNFIFISFYFLRYFYHAVFNDNLLVFYIILNLIDNRLVRDLGSYLFGFFFDLDRGREEVNGGELKREED